MIVDSIKEVKYDVVCNSPNETDRFPEFFDGVSKSSEGLPTPETSPLRPPKPPRTEVRQYSWRNSYKEGSLYVHTHTKTIEN